MQATKEGSNNYKKLVEVSLLALAMFATKEDCQAFKELATKCQNGYNPMPMEWHNKFSPQGKKILKSIFKTCGLIKE